MNYRHIYHAGNTCDVVKHVTLALVLRRLAAKETPFAVLDTHAGLGRYDLLDERAQKTMEADAGVRRFLSATLQGDAAALLEPYLKVIRALNPDGNVTFYPGSPLIARGLLRPHDRLVACELHPEDVCELRHLFQHDRQTQIHHRDGYEALRALLPFSEKRGLVFIDPPFEKTDEIDRLVEAIKTIHQRMPQAVVAVWYPIKERPAIWRFHEALTEAGLPKLLAAEFMFHPETRHDRLNGSGFVFMNMPWKLDEELEAVFHVLHEALGTEKGASTIKPLTSR